MKWFAKKVFDGGGNGLKNRCKSYGYLSKFFKNLKYFADKFLTKIKNLYQKLTFFRYDKIGGAGSRAWEVRGASYLKCFLTTVCRGIKKVVSDIKRKPWDSCTEKIPLAGAPCRGSILIEFAVCMPVLIILLFYIHDLMKIKRYYSQTEFVAQQMANILQNIAKTRKVTKYDIKYAAALAYLTIYPGTTMYTTVEGSEKHTFSHQPRVFIHYVKGEADGKASTKWAVWTRSAEYTTPRTWRYGYLASTDQSAATFATNVTPSTIYPTLKVEEGKPKILIDVQLRKEGNKSAREVFGLRFVNPKYVGTNMTGYFSSVVIFSPNSGFTEKAPE